VARQGRTAALVAPFKPKDAALFALISAFDAAYANYNEFQNLVERFWTLRWLEQNQVGELDAALIKPGVARAEALPLVFALPGTDHLPRGARVRARIAGMDLLTLDLHATLAATIAAPAAGAAAGPDDVAAGAAEDDEEAALATLAAGPLHLAIDDAAAEAEAESAAATAAMAATGAPANAAATATPAEGGAAA
jgi:exoribonuclease-2